MCLYSYIFMKFYYRDPNNDGLAEWPCFDGANRNYMVLKKNPSSAENYKPEKITFWKDAVYH